MKSFSVLLFLCLAEQNLLVTATGRDEFTQGKDNNAGGPCIIRRTKLPRLDPVKVGHVQNIELVPGDALYAVTTLSTRPPIFEIPDFLSEHECDELLKIVESQTLTESGVFHFSLGDVNAKHETKFSDWDTNRDDVIDENELTLRLLDLRDLHFTKQDFEKLLHALSVGKIVPGTIHRREFSSENILGYADRLRYKNPKVRGRHSKQTYIIGAKYEELALILDLKKMALTGLPLKIIANSESPVAVNYGVGGHYHGHYDSHSLRTKQPCCGITSLKQCRVCRYITILYFLNDVEEGGQTAFPVANNKTFSQKEWNQRFKDYSNLSAHCTKANLAIKPRRRTAIMWYNHVINPKTKWVGHLDPTSYHGGCDVIRGHKWIVNNWINVMGGSYKDVWTWKDPDKKMRYN